MEKKAALETMKRVRAARESGPGLAEAQRHANRILRALRTALAEGPATVPELTQRCGLTSREVFWWVNALRKYGEAEIVGPEGSFLRYRALAKEQKK